MSLPFSAMMRTTPSFSSYVSLSVFAVKSTRSPRAFLNQMRKTAFSAIVTIPPARYEVVSDLAWSPTILRYSMRQIARIIAVAAVLCILGSPALAAASVPARYQLRGHLPDLGERPTMRAFLTQAAYDAYRSSLGDANVFPPASSLFMSFDKDILALYTRGNDLGGRCIATAVSAGLSTDVTISLAWQLGTCGAPITAHYPFILMSLSRAASDGTSWVQTGRSVCAMVETADTSACAPLGSGTTAAPAATATPAAATASAAPTAAAAQTASAAPTPTRTVTPTATTTATAVAATSPTPTAVPTRSAVAVASPTAAPETAPNAVDLWLGAALVGLGVMVGIAIMAMRRPREPLSSRT